MRIALCCLVWAALACGTAIPDAQPYATCPTPTAQPTAIISPTPPGGVIVIPTLPPTPYVIRPPQMFHLGDAVWVGQQQSPVWIRFRLDDVRTANTAEGTVHLWTLSVYNAGTAVYSIAPTLALTLNQIRDVDGTLRDGVWIATRDAGDTVGIIVDAELFDIEPGAMRTFQFAAFGLEGVPQQWVLALDLTGGSDNAITWANRTNPHCRTE